MSVINRFFKLNKEDKTMVYLFMGTLKNIVFASFKLLFGFITSSIWLIANGIFYIVIALSRIFSIKEYLKTKKVDNQNKEIIEKDNYKLSGILLIILGISYFVLSIFMYNKLGKSHFEGYIVYGVAFMAFWNLGSSIYGIIKFKITHSPIIRATRIINLATAFTSIVTTQVVLLDNLSEFEEHNTQDGIVGIVVSAIIVIMGISMIIKIEKEKKAND